MWTTIQWVFEGHNVKLKVDITLKVTETLLKTSQSSEFIRPQNSGSLLATNASRFCSLSVKKREKKE